MPAILDNFALVAAISSIILAQAVKIPLFFLVKKTWKPGLGFSTGGMPSSHSAAVSSLTTAIGLMEGLSSSSFAIAVVVSAITMYDATGIRRHAGIHATFLNRIMKSFGDDGKSPTELKEMLGHKPIEVLAGVAFGILISMILYFSIYR